MDINKIKYLLYLVIDNYLNKWEPIWSKFLHSLDQTEYAPSTLRKYLNYLEKEWLVFQPYNSSWRIPTIKWLSSYIDQIILKDSNDSNQLLEIDLDITRKSLKWLVESVWKYIDWTLVGFIKDDEYYYLWINNLLKDEKMIDYSYLKYIIKFIEEKKIIIHLNKKIIKNWKIYYDFIEFWENSAISCLFSKIIINWYTCVIAILWWFRMDYKKNISLLKRLLENNL